MAKRTLILRDEASKLTPEKMRAALKNVKRGVQDRLDEVNEAAYERAAEQAREDWDMFSTGKDW